MAVASAIGIAICLSLMHSSHIPMKRLPLIGVTMSHSVRKGSPYDYVNRSYLNAVKMAGGIPVPIPNVDTSIALVGMCDGMLFTGGGDVHPKNYGEEVEGTDVESIEEARDDTERGIFNHAIEEGMPVLGICRGIQSINVFAGGTLIQDIGIHSRKTNGGAAGLNHRQAEDRHKPSHSIRIKEGTVLHSIQRKGERRVNSLHHQAIGRVPDGWTVSAVAEDGIIEAIERPGPSFMMAVQWHPEELAAESEDDLRLFEALVSRSSEHSAAGKS